MNSSSTSYVRFPVDFVSEACAATTQSELLDTIAKWLPLIVDADRASVTLSSDGVQLRVIALEGIDAIETDRCIPVEGSSAGRAFQAEQTRYSRDMSTETDLQDFNILAQAGLRSCINAPLRSSGNCFGTINVAHKKTDHYCAQDIAILESLAQWLAAHLNAIHQVQQLQELASIDSLTRLLNRRAFLSHGERAFETWLATNTQFSCAIVDIDFFKKVNDEFGHAGGDTALTAFSNHIRSLLRKSDIVGRLGGEEFGILLPGLSRGEAEQWADRLRKSVGELKVSFEDAAIQFTLSIGVTQPDQDDDGFPSLLKRADRNLYDAKSSGRNRVIAA